MRRTDLRINLAAMPRLHIRRNENAFDMSFTLWARSAQMRWRLAASGGRVR
jgi:hypothetical protein